MMKTKSKNFGHIFTIVVAGAAVTSCVLVGYAMCWLDVNAPYLAMLPAIVVCCALGGLVLASWAILFSAIALWYFFLSPGGFAVPNSGDFGHLLFFVLVAFFACWLIDGLRYANLKLTRDNVVLGIKISSYLKYIKPKADESRKPRH